MNVRTKFEVRNFTRSWDNRGHWKKFGQSLNMPTLTFLQNFNGLLFGCILWTYRPNLKFIALAVPEIIVIEVLDGISKPQSWGTAGHRGSGMLLFERALVSSYMPSIVTFLYLYAFQRYCRFCAPARHFPMPPLVSPKCSAGSRWMVRGPRRVKVLG